MTKNFKDMLGRVRGCTLCATHLPLGPRPIVQASSKARLLIAGQAPGRKVHESGIPFDDASGDRLREWLGIDREVFYDPDLIAILPMGFCYPGTGKTGDLPPRAECAPAWRAEVLGQMPGIQLTLVVGQYAMQWHLGLKTAESLTEVVRRWRDYWPARLPLPHPSPRNNIWLKKNPWFESDVLPALRTRVREVLGN
jgi:uracil-DNA glycosylase